MILGGTKKRSDRQREIDDLRPPSYREFGVPEFTDSVGREYRWKSTQVADQGVLNPHRGSTERMVLYIRYPIRRRTKKEQLRGTLIGGNTHNRPGAPGSLSGGLFNSRWPQVGERIALEKIGTNEVYEGHVQRMFAEPRRSTGVVVLYSPGLLRIQ